MTGFRFAMSLVAVLLPTLLVTAAFAQTNPASQVDQAAVELVLARNCLGCHAGAEPAGEFDLTLPDLAVRGEAKDEPPLDSLFWERIESGEMPPEGEIPAADRAVIEAWLKSGANWNRPRIDPLQLSTEARAGRDWWSLQRLSRPAVPPSPDDAAPTCENPRNSISESGYGSCRRMAMS